MTIAACYVSPEGVVLGADSTSTYSFPNAEHHFNFGQKLFEIGEGGTLAIVTWGLGGLAVGSYRTMAAELADDLESNPTSTVEGVADRWISRFWPAYNTSLAADIAQVRALASAKPPFDPLANPPVPAARTLFEEYQLLQMINNLTVGFCIGGYVLPNRSPAAFEVVFEPLSPSQPIPHRLGAGHSFWGVPATITRLIDGCAAEVKAAILMSGRWNGTLADLDAVIEPYKLTHPTNVPIREAVDFTHACLLTTVKALKFSDQARVCGGPIEIAVVTTDRPFRWVVHKDLGAAIRESNA